MGIDRLEGIWVRVGFWKFIVESGIDFLCGGFGEVE